MNIKTLSYFITVVEEQNISAAAKKLCMSQPPLSNQIKNLETMLNTKLFIRGKRNLELTDSGKLLYIRAKEIVSLVDKASQEILSMSSGISGTISIGLVEGSAPNIAAEWMSSFIKSYPQIKFRIIDGNSDDLLAKLRSGLINLAIVTSPCDKALLNSFSLGKEIMSAFMSVNNPLAKKEGDTLDFKELIGQPLIVPTRKELLKLIHSWFDEFDATPEIVCEMDNYLDVAAMAGRDVGISIFPKTSFVLNPTIVSKDIVNPKHYMEYLFVWRKGQPLPAAEAAFVEYVKQAL